MSFIGISGWVGRWYCFEHSLRMTVFIIFLYGPLGGIVLKVRNLLEFVNLNTTLHKNVPRKLLTDTQCLLSDPDLDQNNFRDIVRNCNLESLY
jgi:hypothetical protein